MSNATYTDKDQNHADETTIYWFELEGDAWGVADCNGEKTIVDCDGCPVNTNDVKNAHLPAALIVTDEMVTGF